MSYQYYTCDVFTSKAFGGNPLAVIPDARGLSGQQMQQIAREFNYSETTFVLPPEDEGTRKVRIFTPHRELPFAGHPNLGTAFVLVNKESSLSNETSFIFEEVAGKVTVSIDKEQESAFYELKAPQDFILGPEIPVALIAEALGIPPEKILTNTHNPLEASVGLPMLFVQIESDSVLNSIRLHRPAFEALEKMGLNPALHVYTHVAPDPKMEQGSCDGEINCRMFAPLFGIQEDPATGSANCALAGVLAAFDQRDNYNYCWKINQGVAMGRPSQLRARAQKEQGNISNTWVGGHSVMISEGTLLLDSL